MASPRERTPSCWPAEPMTRTSRARIFPLILTYDPGEGEREGKGRLKRPPPVGTYSCFALTIICKRAVWHGLTFRPAGRGVQVHNCRGSGGFADDFMPVRKRRSRQFRQFQDKLF